MTPASTTPAVLASRELTTLAGRWTELVYRDSPKEAVALVFGTATDISAERVPLCRIHSECYSAQVLLSTECDCQDQMRVSQALIQRSGYGVIVTLPHDGRGFGHAISVRVAELVRSRSLSKDVAFKQLHDGVADNREFSLAVQILQELGIDTVDLLTQNDHKVTALRQGGIRVRRVIPVPHSS